MASKYLSNLIGDEYKNWGNRKILIAAPTGMGKTTFIVKTLLPYLRYQKKKLLILCNRRLLRQQYWFDLVNQYDDYIELEESVQIKTYQELAIQVQNNSSIESLFADFQTIVCDEVHYFYADSDFNGFGTFALLQMIIHATLGKTVIFLSATMEEVKPFIVQTIKNSWTSMDRSHELKKNGIDETCKEIIDKNFSYLEDYHRFNCICMPDIQTLCAFLSESPKKSVVFIDSKERAFKMRETIIKNGKIGSQEIVLLNADNIDVQCNSECVRNLTISHRLLPKILITTSVLDNGVSIHDPDVANVVIVTESKISFLQMLGRVRAELVNECNLIFVSRTADAFLKRMNKYERFCEEYKKLERMNLNRQMDYFEKMIWSNTDELVDFYRNALVKMPYEYQNYTLPEKIHIKCTYGNEELYINKFAQRKTGNMYLIESKFFAQAVIDPLKIIYEQISWIGKEPYELQIEESTYSEALKEQFITALLSVQDFTNEQLQEFKKQLVHKFHKDFFKDIPVKNQTLSLGKLKEICGRFDLAVQEKIHPKNQKKMYSIRMKNENENEN